MQEKYDRTGIFIMDADNWKWAKYRASTLGFKSVSEYLFELIKKRKEGTKQNTDGLSKSELKNMIEKNPFVFGWDETDEVFNVSLTIFKDKWICENDNHTFNDPAWLESPSSENPICPKCESLNIDLLENVVDFNPAALMRLFDNKSILKVSDKEVNEK